MSVIKRDRASSSKALAESIGEFAQLLAGQDEAEAVDTLNGIGAVLREAEPGSASFKKAIEDLIDCFEGDHELIAYTHQRSSKEWSEADQLFLASSKVLSLARRLKV